MSIETERWTLDESTGRVVHAEDSGPWAGMPVGRDRPEVRRATAVLPEALALLKRQVDEWELDTADSERIKDVLRRAGVLR